MSPWIIVLLCIMWFQQACGNEHVTGYLGQSVVLKSSADRSWTLTRVQWSIYTNTTYIASLKDGDVTIFDFWRHRGRLQLDNRTGDLTINDVNMNDSMIYTVALVTSNDTRQTVKVHLTVLERLKEPTIQKTLVSLKDGQCHVAVNCTIFSQNVNLSLMPDSEFNGFYVSGKAVNSSLVLFMSFSENRNVTVNCTASSGQQKETKQITVGCSAEKQTCEDCTTSPQCALCSSCASSVFLTFVLTALAVVGLVCAYKWRDKIKDALLEAAMKLNRTLRGTSSESGVDENKTERGQNVKKEDRTTSLAQDSAEQ